MRRGRLVSIICNLIREGRFVIEGSVIVREGGYIYLLLRRFFAGLGI